MLGHLGLNVADLREAQRYYDELAPLIEFETYFARDEVCAYRPSGGKPGTYLFLYQASDPTPYSRERTGLQHLAFMVRSRGDVHLVHDHVAAQGGTILHAPREFPEYPPPYYATFWLDPFGFMMEAVCHYDRD